MVRGTGGGGVRSIAEVAGFAVVAGDVGVSLVVSGILVDELVLI